MRLDWGWLRRSAGVAAITTLTIVGVIQGIPEYASDFHGGVWTAGQAILAGRPVYPYADGNTLAVLMHAYVLPPPLAFLGLPLSLLPFPAAAIIWTLLDAAAFALALRLVGLRERWAYLLAFCSAPYLSAIHVGAVEPLLALGLAGAWRYREGVAGGACVGLVISAKLLAWPLVLWLLVTRRWRAAFTAALTGTFVLLATWSVIGFNGLSSYPRLMKADAAVFMRVSDSVAAAVLRLGGERGSAPVLALVAAVALSLAIARVSGWSDWGFFAASVSLGLLASPLVWMHYYVVVFVLLAAAGKPSRRVWWLTALWWLMPMQPPPRFGLVLTIALFVAVLLRDALERGSVSQRLPSVSRIYVRPAREVEG